MENSVRHDIEKIQLQELDNEVRLKEKRELNAAIISLKRGIRDTVLNIENLKKEYQSLIITTDKLENQVTVEKILNNALAAQVNDCRNEIKDLQRMSINGLESVWEKRSELFNTVHKISDKCGIWALLRKPNYEIKSSVAQLSVKEPSVLDDTKLNEVKERKRKAIAHRNFLLTEPDVGEEFIRTRNALQYSFEIMATDQMD